jgi:PLP dependent protein
VTEITYHLADVRERVVNALVSAARTDDSVTIVAVSKQQPAAVIEAAFRAGQRHFGESYVQEALDKMDALSGLAIEWHFIGRVQANKTRPVAERFGWVHTIDRLKIAARLNEQRPHYAPPLNVFLQVNQTGDPRRSGIAEQELETLARQVEELPRLHLRGLMTIPPADATADVAARHFRRLFDSARRLEAAGIVARELSMGMSGDFEIAIREGATCVRIGTAIFGARGA